MVKSQLKAQFFVPNYLISINGSLNTFMLACDTDCIHEAAVMQVLPNYVNETFADALNSLLCATDNSFPITTPVRNSANRSSKLLQLYREVVDYMLKKFATYKDIA